MYLLVPMEPRNKTSTTVSQGSINYPRKLSEKSSQHFFLRGQRSKVKVSKCDLFPQPDRMKPYNIPYESSFFMLQGGAIYFMK